jgi:protein involved in polysaccharide export with SLBB domain
MVLAAPDEIQRRDLRVDIIRHDTVPGKTLYWRVDLASLLEEGKGDERLVPGDQLMVLLKTDALPLGLPRHPATSPSTLPSEDGSNQASNDARFLYVGGLVKHPGYFNLLGNHLTLKGAIISAGMLADDAPGDPRIEITRPQGASGDRTLVWNVDVVRLFKDGQGDEEVRAGDRILVQPGKGLVGLTTKQAP